jgi:hypothetical protein
MCNTNKVKKVFLVSTIVSMGLLYLPMQAQASGVLVVNRGQHERQGRYTEVVVDNSRYYYDQGVFYTGDPGRYVVVEAPAGAVVYSIPSGHERVNIDGVFYYRYRDVYYQPAGRGYRVVRIDRSRMNKQNQRRGGENRGGYQDVRQDVHQEVRPDVRRGQ